MTPNEENTPSPLAGKRVLIAEDEGVVLLQMRKMFQQHGAQIVGLAANGQEAIEIALRERPDIILMDIHMPILNGMDAAEQILAHYSPCLIFVTAYSDRETRQKAMAMGVWGYLVKPVTKDTLLETILKCDLD